MTTLLAYADAISVRPGDTIGFKVSCDGANHYTARIARLLPMMPESCGGDFVNAANELAGEDHEAFRAWYEQQRYVRKGDVERKLPQQCVVSIAERKGTGAQSHGRRPSRINTSGTPSSAVTTPTGICNGAQTLRAAVSANVKNAPPISAAPGISQR